jgi:hypothetical protein
VGAAGRMHLERENVQARKVSHASCDPFHRPDDRNFVAASPTRNVARIREGIGGEHACRVARRSTSIADDVSITWGAGAIHRRCRRVARREPSRRRLAMAGNSRDVSASFNGSSPITELKNYLERRHGRARRASLSRVRLLGPGLALGALLGALGQFLGTLR